MTYGFFKSSNCDRFGYMMHSPMSTEAEYQAREDTRWILSQWWIKRLPSCASGAA